MALYEYLQIDAILERDEDTWEVKIFSMMIFNRIFSSSMKLFLLNIHFKNQKILYQKYEKTNRFNCS